MTTTEPSAAPAQFDTGHMRAIQATLAACGLATRLTDARAGFDLTATLSPGRLRKAEFWIDDQGYAEIRFWYPPGTPATEIAAAAVRALQAVTTAAAAATGTGTGTGTAGRGRI
jgi:hypothetical protein